MSRPYRPSSPFRGHLPAGCSDNDADRQASSCSPAPASGSSALAGQQRAEGPPIRVAPGRAESRLVRSCKDSRVRRPISPYKPGQAAPARPAAASVPVFAARFSLGRSKPRWLAFPPPARKKTHLAPPAGRHPCLVSQRTGSLSASRGAKRTRRATRLLHLGPQAEANGVPTPRPHPLPVETGSSRLQHPPARLRGWRARLAAPATRGDRRLCLGCLGGHDVLHAPCRRRRGVASPPGGCGPETPAVRSCASRALRRRFFDARQEHTVGPLPAPRSGGVFRRSRGSGHF